VRLMLLLAVVVGLCSCGPNKNSMSADTRDSIMGGTPSAPTSQMGISTVAIYNQKGGYMCTGSLLPDNFILTAAHCVEGAPSDLVLVFNTDMDSVLNAHEPDVKQELMRTVIATRVHPDYIYDQEKAPEFNASDIALLKFRGTVPAGYAPAKMLKDSSLLKRGATVKVAGFGVRKVDAWEIDVKKFTREQLEKGEENGEIYCDEEYKTCMGVEMDETGLLYEAEAKIKALMESEFMLDESKGTATCSGDSGGPAYLKVGNDYFLAGITSRGSLLCNQEGVYTDILFHKTWIMKAAKELAGAK